MGTTCTPLYLVDKLFYYLFSEEESCCITLKLRLHVRIDKENLNKALVMALKRFPNFRKTLILDAEGFPCLVENPRPLKLFLYDDEPANLGSPETNGYLFRVMLLEDKLCISVFHGISDGKGLLMFARTLLYYYFTFGGCLLENGEGKILTCELPEDPSEQADPFAGDPQIGPAARVLFEEKDYFGCFQLPEVKIEQTRARKVGHRRFQIILNTERLLSLAHEVGMTLDTWFNFQVAKTIRKTYGTGNAHILEMAAVDQRPFYHNSRYLNNFRELFWVDYSAEVLGLPEKEAGKLIRQRFLAPQLCKAHLDGVNYRNKQLWTEWFAFPVTDRKSLKALRAGLFSRPEEYVTFFTTNVGRFDSGTELDLFIADAEIYAPCIFPYPSFFLLSHGNTTIVDLVQKYPEDRLYKALLNTFGKPGLYISSGDRGLHESDRLNLPAKRR